MLSSTRAASISPLLERKIEEIGSGISASYSLHLRSVGQGELVQTKIAKRKSKFIQDLSQDSKINYQALREQLPTLEIECYAKPLEIDDLIKKMNEELDSPSS